MSEYVDDRVVALETERLEHLLALKKIDTSAWKTEQGNKTVKHLATELLQGDAVLENLEGEGEPMRVAHVVNLYVYAVVNGQKMQLIEDRQVFNDAEAKVRERGMEFLSEKKKINEDLGDACKRALSEEIQLDSKTDIVFLGSYDKVKESPSFPGLKSAYKIFDAETTLAEDQYNPEGYLEVQRDKTTYFVWKALGTQGA